MPFSGGTGTELDPFLIANEVDLLSLVALWNVDGYKGKYYQQTADITLSAPFPMIGDGAEVTTIIYDAQGYKLLGIDVDGSTDQWISFFRFAEGEGVQFKRMDLAGEVKGGNDTCGLLAHGSSGEVTQEIEDCIVRCDVVAQAAGEIVGIGGEGTGKISRSLFLGRLTCHISQMPADCIYPIGFAGTELVDCYYDSTMNPSVIGGTGAIGLTTAELKSEVPVALQSAFRSARDPVTAAYDYWCLKSPLDRSLTISAGAGGVLSLLPAGMWEYRGTVDVSIVASANAGYRFKEWTGDGAAKVANVNSATTTINLDGSYSIQATFGVVPISKKKMIIKLTSHRRR